ncbi:prephenate dehydrogenase [Dietzia cinnamea P4]|nr:prephenate dehydrogenase [Dietzia cinnamea P4]
MAEHAPGVALTDVISVKAPVLDAVRRHGLGARFVGGHPMAGTAHSGWDAGDPDLFRGATWLVAADSGADPDTWARVARLAMDSGARILSATSAEHDAAVAGSPPRPRPRRGARAGRRAGRGPRARAGGRVVPRRHPRGGDGPRPGAGHLRAQQGRAAGRAGRLPGRPAGSAGVAGRAGNAGTARRRRAPRAARLRGGAGRGRGGRGAGGGHAGRRGVARGTACGGGGGPGGQARRLSPGTSMIMPPASTVALVEAVAVNPWTCSSSLDRVTVSSVTSSVMESTESTRSSADPGWACSPRRRIMTLAKNTL